MAESNKSFVVQELEEESGNRIFTGPAKRIIDKLAPMSSHVEAYQKRWFWELLQNACDYNDNVKIELEINSATNTLAFRHNGGSFTMNQALNLILPDSDKDDKEDVDIIGKYGSGFLSTHILSTQIDVSGFLLTKQQQEHSFQFTLDRSSREEKGKSQLATALQESKTNFRNSLKPDSPKGRIFTTEFKYDLNKTYSFAAAKETVVKGLLFFRKVIPFVFAFQPRLLEIAIKINGKTSIYTIHSRETSKIVTKVERYQGEIFQSEEEISVVVASEDNVFVAVEVQDDKIVEFADDFPKLFKVYPLVGTEEFPFPCVVHSLGLIPTLERNAIELSENDTNNRQVLQKATTAYGKMLELLSADNRAALYHICKLTTGAFDSKIQEWFKLNISDKLKTKLYSHRIVLNNLGTRSTLEEIKIPILDNKHYKDYYNLITKTIFLIPDESEVEQWGKILNFTVFTDSKFDFKNLFQSVLDTNKPLGTFLREDVEIYGWVKQLINLILLSDEKELLYEKTIIPQQDGKLRGLKNELFWDDGIDEELKDILELISEDSYRKVLLHKSIEEIGTKLLDSKKQKTEKDILAAIDQALKESAAKDSRTDKFIEALRRILKWTSKMDDADLKNRMSWFGVERAYLVMKILASEENRDMAFKIIQSGKIEALAKLAEADVTVKQLESILKISESNASIDDLLKLVAISDEVGYSKILKSAEDILDEKREFEFKNKIGHSVEELLRELLLVDLPNYEAKFIGTGPYDFRITNKANAKEYYLELKSVKEANTDPIKMAISQARHSSKYPERYALCVIKRPAVDMELTKDYLSQNIKCIYQVGTDVKAAVEESLNVDNYIKASKSIKLEIKDPEMKVLLDFEYIKTLGKSFVSLKEKIIAQLG
jgi:hypothetical protein